MIDQQEYIQFDRFIVTEIKPFVAHVQINRPRSYNAFDQITWIQYEQVFTKLDKDHSVKVIILSGDGGDDKKLRNHIDEFQNCIGITARISTPTIGLIHGLSIGLALDIVAPLAIRVITKDAKLSIREIAIGIVADIGSLQRLPLVWKNQSKLNEYALTGEFWTSRDAWENGFVSYVEQDKLAGLARCIEIATKIIQHDRWCIRGTKRSLTQMNEIGVKEGLQDVAATNTENIDTIKLTRNLKKIIKL